MPLLELTEWQQKGPSDYPELRGLSIAPSDRELIDRLARNGRLTISELRDGLSVETTSFVGSLAIGNLTLRIQPKITGRHFSVLIGYALGLPQIDLLPQHDVALSRPAFQDFIVARLSREVSRLIARGIHRTYVQEEQALTNPRGRLLLDRLAQQAIPTATLSCRFHHRDSDVLPNRVLLAGLQLAARLALDQRIRTTVLQQKLTLAEQCRPIRLDRNTFRQLRRISNRLIRDYETAFLMIRLLMAGRGVGTTLESEATELPGFLFDMNRLYQDALGRFLSEWLADAKVSPQYRLTDVFRYQAMFNPRRKRIPTPRPDFVVSREGRVVAIADAKYRDLWERDLPREMLYQLTVYALSQRECTRSTILYATDTQSAREARIAIADPLTSEMRGEVCLRPVVVSEFSDVVTSPRSLIGDRRRRAYAEHLAFGG